MRQSKVILAIAVLVLTAGGAGLSFFLSRPEPSQPGGATPIRPGASAAGAARQSDASGDAGAASAVRDVEARALSSAPRTTATTVAWPVEVELTLVREADLLQADGELARGAGRLATLRGCIQGLGERGVRATLTIEAGLNKGRTLETNEEGFFGASDLYPGLALVRVQGPAIVGSLREVRLVAEREVLLNIGYGLPGSVSGTVYDEAQKPLADVGVELDGQHTTTDADGRFGFAQMTAGTDLVLMLRKPGYATYYKYIGVPLGRAAPPNQFTFTLEPAAKLEITVPERIGDAGPATVVLLPQLDPIVEHHFPWHELSGISVPPGSSRLIDGLPAGQVSVRVYRGGAQAKPQNAVAILAPGRIERLTVHLEPAPRVWGRATDPEGNAVENAEVVLEAPDRVGATAMHMAAMPSIFEQTYFEGLPPGMQRTRTDYNGEFTLSAWEDFAPTRYLTVTSADGRLAASRVVRAGTTQVDVQLSPRRERTVSLQLDFPGRHQGLPVRLSVDGQTRPEVVVPNGDRMPVDGLKAGRWRLGGRWHGEALFPAPGFRELDLTKDETVEVRVPQDAIDGQDEDTVRRARGGNS